MSPIADNRGERRDEADAALSESERLDVVLQQALDEWLRVYIVNQLRNITAQPSDGGAVERSLVGARKAIAGWRRGRQMIKQLSEENG